MKLWKCGLRAFRSAELFGSAAAELLRCNEEYILIGKGTRPAHKSSARQRHRNICAAWQRRSERLTHCLLEKRQIHPCARMPPAPVRARADRLSISQTAYSGAE